MTEIRKEMDSLGEVNVPADKLWGPQTQRSLEHFSISKDLTPREMITAYATLKKAAANANHAGKRLDDRAHKLIVRDRIDKDYLGDIRRFEILERDQEYKLAKRWREHGDADAAHRL